MEAFEVSCENTEFIAVSNKTIARGNKRISVLWILNSTAPERGKTTKSDGDALFSKPFALLLFAAKSR